MDLIQFGLNVIGGGIRGTTDVVGLVVSSALGAMGVTPSVSNAVALVVGNISGGAVATAGVFMTAYGGIKTALWAIFNFSPEEWLLNHTESVGYRVGKRGKKIVQKYVKEQDARQYIGSLADNAMDRFKVGVDRAISE